MLGSHDKHINSKDIILGRTNHKGIKKGSKLAGANIDNKKS
jgi:hypothetical protein